MPPEVHRVMLRALLVFGLVTLSASAANADAQSAARDAVVGCWNVGSGVTLDLTPAGGRGLVAVARFAERPRGGPARQRTRTRWVPDAQAFELQCRPRSRHGSFCHVRPDAGGLEVRVYTRGHRGRVSATPRESLVATRCSSSASNDATPNPAAQSGFAWTPLNRSTLAADLASRWGVVVAVGETTQARFEAPYDRYALTTAHCSEYCVTVARVRTPMPAADVAVAAFVRQSMGQSPDQAVTLARGTSPSGIVFVARRFSVRMGTPGLARQSIHYMAEVSRFFATIPLDASSHLVCTGYVEHAVASMDDPAMRAARDVCLSLARVP